MATGIRILTVAAWLLFSCIGSAQAGEPSCLECHPVHYQENGSCTGCHLGNPDSTRKDIAHHQLIAARFAAFTLGQSKVVEEGQKLIEKTACRRCHVSSTKGNPLAANLDWSPHNSTAEELFTAIKEPALFMPAFHFSEAQLVSLVNAIQAGSRQAPIPVGEVPLVIHFEDLLVSEESLFEKKCGGCHRLLSKTKGGMGSGNIGPNLSGLMTEFYPKSYPEKKAWTAQGLEDWLKNPRKLLKNASMAPVGLKEEEWQKLKTELFDGELADRSPE